LKGHTIKSNTPYEINFNVTIIEDVKNNTIKFKVTT
jgi:hypothetical protein